MNYLKFLFTLIFTISSFNVFADESKDLKQNDNDVKVENTESAEETDSEEDEKVTVESYIGKVGGKEGVKLEQQYLVGENGLELMSHHPLEDV